MPEIDTTNRFFVGGGHHTITITGAPCLQPLSRSEALNLAAWLVALADFDDEFPAVLEAVRNT